MGKSVHFSPRNPKSVSLIDGAMKWKHSHTHLCKDLGRVTYLLWISISLSLGQRKSVWVMFWSISCSNCQCIYDKTIQRTNLFPKGLVEHQAQESNILCDLSPLGNKDLPLLPSLAAPTKITRLNSSFF